MNEAERLIPTHPDSSLSILSAIDTHTLGDEEEKARYALLMSMALDKNYIDATTFEILQPAIDYYLKKGTPDEKLRTLYYQGRICQNGKNDDMAMQSFIQGREYIETATDTLTAANLLVAQGVIIPPTKLMTLLKITRKRHNYTMQSTGLTTKFQVLQKF